jgi:hypothetical protein
MENICPNGYPISDGWTYVEIDQHKAQMVPERAQAISTSGYSRVV